MTNCIIAPGTPNPDGYCRTRGRYAHRRAWEEARGPIPSGLTVDHECGETRCINVEHLSLTTYAENTRRAWDRRGGRVDHAGPCRRGHPANWRRQQRGWVCRTCHAEQSRESRRVT